MRKKNMVFDTLAPHLDTEPQPPANICLAGGAFPCPPSPLRAQWAPFCARLGAVFEHFPGFVQVQTSLCHLDFESGWQLEVMCGGLVERKMATHTFIRPSIVELCLKPLVVPTCKQLGNLHCGVSGGLAWHRWGPKRCHTSPLEIPTVPLLSLGGRVGTVGSLEIWQRCQFRRFHQNG